MYTSVYNRECWQQFIIQTRSIKRKMAVKEAYFQIYTYINNALKHICIHMCVYIHVYTHTHTHTHAGTSQYVVRQDHLSTYWTAGISTTIISLLAALGTLLKLPEHRSNNL